MFETNATIGVRSGRYYTFGVDTVYGNCDKPAATHPSFQFEVGDGKTWMSVGGRLNGCGQSTAGRSITVERPKALGKYGQGATTTAAYANSLVADASFTYDQDSLAIRLRNENGVTDGNDGGFDNIRLLDVTPHLSKSFSPTVVEANRPTTLAFTVSNTAEKASKKDWSFTDRLSAGVTVATPANIGGTCVNKAGAPLVVTATPAGDTISVTGGDLAAAAASCTVTVDVVGAAPGAGATDVHLETGEAALLAAMDAQWAGVHERKMYLTGAYGSRQDGEAFGDDHELPSDLADAETCATIADLHWTWRMLLAGGGAGTGAYASVMEREIRNALAASVDATGTRFFYANPLQLRPDRRSGAHTTRDRVPWFDCACCPPNIARTVAQLGAYLATVGGDTLYLHQFRDADVALPEGLGEGSVGVRTRYPADGRVAIEITGTPAPNAVLAVRVPEWPASGALVAPDGEHTADADGYVRAPLVAGAYVLELDLTPRFTRAHHRVDALRGCVAVERGPVVYCAEPRSTSPTASPSTTWSC